MNEPFELDRASREVIDAGREPPGPKEFVAERVGRAVERNLRGSAPPVRAKLGSATILLASGAVALGGALYATEPFSRPERRAQPSLAPRATERPRTPVAAAPVSAERTTSERVPTALSAVPATRPRGRGETSRPGRSQQLAAEIELLASVNAAVSAGDGRRALALLGEYDSRFGSGILAEERAAASVFSLCTAGRTLDAKAAAERFARRWPRSPLAARVAGSCAGTE